MGASQQRMMLDTICGVVGRSVRADTVCIMESVEKSHGRPLGSWGGCSDSLVGDVGLPNIDARPNSVLLEPDLDHSRWYQQHPLSAFSPFAKRLIAVSLPQADAGNFRYIAALFNSLDRNLSDKDVHHLTHFAGFASFLVRDSRAREGVCSGHSLRVSAGSAPPPLQPVGEEAVLSFLSETLVRSPALRNLNGVPLVVLRQWEKTLKAAQVKALEYLQTGPSTATADLIAHELSENVECIYQGIAFDAVVPASCDESGSRTCMSVLVAEKVSRAINRPFIDVLAGGRLNGLSRPATGRILGAYRNDIRATGHVLIIKDSASSGLNIKRVTDALRGVGVSMSTLAWVGC
jgi:hypothetical protein